MENSPLFLEISKLAVETQDASRSLAGLSTAKKNDTLCAIADFLEKMTPVILEANAKDVDAAKKHGLSAAMVERLRLTPERVKAMAEGVRTVADLPDPVGVIIDNQLRPNGLKIVKRRVPIGVIGIIYESRPNVTCDAAVLCLKAGNAVILRGGSEAFFSNSAIVNVMQMALLEKKIPAGAISFVPTTDREAVSILCKLDKYIDVIVPRGGYNLIETVVQNARMPVIKHYNGICHVFVEKDADFEMAEDIIINAKCQRPGVCNAMETLLIDAAIAKEFLPKIVAAFYRNKVEIRADDTAKRLLPELENCGAPEFGTEWLDLIVNVGIVDGTDEAIAHIETFGSHHSDAIVTQNDTVAKKFISAVDSATVYWNASTRFTDGFEFGFGAEIGISTDKLHARGPMGLVELTTYKYQIFGTGQIRK